MSYRNNPLWIAAQQQLIEGHPSGDPTATLLLGERAAHIMYEIEEAAELDKVGNLLRGGSS